MRTRVVLRLRGLLRELTHRVGNGLGRLCARIADVDGPPFPVESAYPVIAGSDSFHNGNLRILGQQPVQVGSYCAFGRDVILVTENHDTNFLAVQGSVYRKMWSEPHPGVLQVPPNPERTKGGICIGSDVWLGDRVVVMSGVRIGNGACVGTGAIVTKDVDPYSVVAGVPARPIRHRVSPEVAQLLLELRWWEWPSERILRNHTLFRTNLRQLSAAEIRDLVR